MNVVTCDVGVEADTVAGDGIIDRSD